MENKLKLIINLFGENRFKRDELLIYHTFLKLGGFAKLFFIAFTQNEIIKIIKTCHDLDVPYIFYGIGSKINFSNLGFEGVVIQNRTKNIDILSIKGKVSKEKGNVGVGVDQAVLEVESGVSVKKLAEYLDSHGFVKDEFVSVPGSIGGNIFVNKSLQQRAQSIKIMHQDGNIDIIASSDLSLRKHIVLSLALRVKAK